jgi:hypothetical protein
MPGFWVEGKVVSVPEFFLRLFNDAVLSAASNESYVYY